MIFGKLRLLLENDHPSFDKTVCKLYGSMSTLSLLFCLSFVPMSKTLKTHPSMYNIQRFYIFSIIFFSWESIFYIW